MSRFRSYIIIVLSFLIGWSSAHAQKNISNLFIRNAYKGDKMFLNLYYDQAITYYKLALKKDIDNNSLKLKIADSYRLISDYNSSLYWYEEVFNEYPEEGKAIDKYHYAETLVSAARYDDANTWYKNYQLEVPTDSRPDRKMSSVNQLSYFFRDSLGIKVDNLPFNTEFDELAATKYHNGLVFLSSRESHALVDQDFLREGNLLDLYYVAYDSSAGWQLSKNFDKDINTPYHEGPLSFYNGENKLILTRSNVNDGIQHLSTDGKTKAQLVTVSKEGNRWLKVEPLPFSNPEYSFAHPNLSSENDTLYFSSDMEGGLGGNDLYMSIRQGDSWSEPSNLGERINTEGDEMYPFIIDDRLFFSSNGYAGLGALDIYKAFVKDGKVIRVINVGYPVNSNHDDFAFSINKTSLSGTFTSNRLGGVGGDDIYGFKYEVYVLNGLVTQEQDGTSISGALIERIQDGEVIATTISDKSGLFHFYLPFTSDFELDVSKDDHRTSIPIKVSSRQKTIDLDTVKISLHKHDLFAQGRILNNETQQLMPDVRVIIHNTTDNDFDTLITDASGIYRFVLEPQKEFSIWAGKSGFLVRGVDINTMQISKGVILNDIVLELEYFKKSIVNFEFDKYDLTSMSISIFRRVAKSMKNTSKHLVISAYADARGTIEYNQILSDKRAKAVLDYFISQGIAPSRITARGFGETLILNKCTDGVHCEEIEHSKNRRAEIKIEGSTVK